MIGDRHLIDWSEPFEPDVPFNRDLLLWHLAGAENPYWGTPKFYDLVPRSSRGGINHGTLTNGPTWVSSLGRRGGFGALSLASSSSQYVTATLPTLSTGSDVSMCAWIRPAASHSTTYEGIVFGGSSGDGYACFYKTDTAEFHGWAATTYGAGLTGAGSVPVSEWSHVAYVYSSGSLRLYVNGVLLSTTSQTWSSTPSGSLFIGRTPGGEYFNGLMDDVRIAARAWSDNDVAAIYTDSARGYPDTLRRMSRAAFYFDVGGGGGTAVPVFVHHNKQQTAA